MITIKDFKISYSILKTIGHLNNFDINDVEVIFTDEKYKNKYDIENNTIILNSKNNLKESLLKIVFLYLQNIMHINNIDISESFFIYYVNYSKKIINDFIGDVDKNDYDDIFSMKSDQHPVSWMLIKNFVCPMYNLKLNNYKIIAAHTGKLDVACFINDIEKYDGLTQDQIPFIYLNLDVKSKSVREAFLFYESLKAYFEGSNISHDTVIKDLFSKIKTRDRIVSFVKMSFIDDIDVYNFFATLSILTQSDDIERIILAEIKNKVVIKLSNKKFKEAQNLQLIDGNWWFLGLIEKMLGGARGPDWSVHTTWQPIIDEFNSRVEREKKRRNLDEVPFEILLRIQSEDKQIDKTQTIQGLLSEDRDW